VPLDGVEGHHKAETHPLSTLAWSTLNAPKSSEKDPTLEPSNRQEEATTTQTKSKTTAPPNTMLEGAPHKGQQHLHNRPTVRPPSSRPNTVHCPGTPTTLYEGSRRRIHHTQQLRCLVLPPSGRRTPSWAAQIPRTGGLPVATALLELCSTTPPCGSEDGGDGEAGRLPNLRRSGVARLSRTRAERELLFLF
jgi:hypothetical protein